MKEKQEILMIILIFFSIGLSGYAQNKIDWKEFNTICYDSLDANSKLVKAPCVLTEFEYENLICDTVVAMIFKGIYDAKYDHYYHYKVVDSAGIYFLITKEVIPGIMMIYNTLLYQVVFNNQRELLGVRDLGCLSCTDNNPGVDQSINIESVLHIDYNEIREVQTTIDGVLFGNPDSTNTTITIDTFIYKNYYDYRFREY